MRVTVQWLDPSQDWRLVETTTGEGEHNLCLSLPGIADEKSAKRMADWQHAKFSAVTYVKAPGHCNMRVLDAVTLSEITSVIEVDTVTGMLERAVTDDNGRFVLTADGAELMTEVIEGQFVIEVNP